MKKMFENLKKQEFINLKCKALAIFTFTLALCLSTSLFYINSFVNDFNYVANQLKETRVKLLNMQLEKIDFIEEQKKKSAFLDVEEKKDLEEQTVSEIKDRFKEVIYTYDKGQISQMDFSNLDISCDTYKKVVLGVAKSILPDSKYINTKCDEVNK